ncbi:hypothetical protein GPJ56_009447 [Histomonas meleagridis]|nr:hypothetical protein GPJ56_009447 [Histomonas meleagridis]
MENACNQILQLWAQMRDNSNPALAQNASGQFSQILSSPDLIYPLISIVENIKEEGIQLYATNFIYIWTKNHFLEADKEKLAQILPKYLQIACTIQTPNYRENICQAALLIESHIKLSPQPFFDLMNTFFQSQNTIGTGFFLASLLLPLYEEIFITIPDFFIKVLSVAAQLLSADTTDTINNVYKFLITFFRFPDLAKQFFDQLSFISEGIHKRFQYLFNVNQNPNEISIFFRMICRSIKCLPEFVHTFLVDLFQVTIPLLLNNQLDPMIRISAFTIFEYAAEYDVSLLAGNIEDYIKHFTEFSLVLCRESPETNEYEAPANFFELVSNELDEETVISLFVPIIEMLTNSNDPFSYLVSIMIIDSIFVSIEAEVLDIFDIFEQLVGKSLVSGNKVLIDKSCQLIDKFISTDESLSAQIIDIFEGFLLQVIPISDNAITTLTNLYDNSSKEPKNIEQTLSIIYEQFKSSSDPYRIEILCQLIAQIVLTISDIQPQYYQAIQPYLSQLIKMGESSYAVAIQTYCSFAHSNPLLLRNDLESLCTIIFNGLSNPNNHNLILKCSTSLQILIENYTITISPFINQFLSRYIQLFNEETPDFSEGKDLDDNEQYNEYLKVLAIYTEMKGQILLTITTIFNYYIDQFASQYLAIKNLLQVSITNEEIKNYAIRSFSEVISGFNKANIDSTELIQIFFKSNQ